MRCNWMKISGDCFQAKGEAREAARAAENARLRAAKERDQTIAARVSQAKCTPLRCISFCPVWCVYTGYKSLLLDMYSFRHGGSGIKPRRLAACAILALCWRI
jgi:hypothetical protein